MANKHFFDPVPLFLSLPQTRTLTCSQDIKAKVAKLPITIKWQWIEGHQDDHLPFHLLNPLAQDNVLADSLAIRTNSTSVDPLASLPAPNI